MLSQAVSMIGFYREALRHPINPLGTTVQCYKESKFFTSILAIKAFNFAGIKVNDAWLSENKPVYKKASAEYNKSTQSWTHPVSSFCVFSSVENFLAYYAEKINTQKRYAVAKNNIDNVWGYYAGIFNGGWATDPDYFKGLTALTLQLAPVLLGKTIWVERLTSAFDLAIKRKTLLAWQRDYVKTKLEGAR